jgi:hypothetical protein
MRKCFALLLFLPRLLAPQEPTKAAIHGYVYADDTAAPARGAKVLLIDHSAFLRGTVGVGETDEHGSFGFAG